MFNIGDIVEYTNKNLRANLTGTVIALDGSYYCIETLSGNSGRDAQRCSFWRFSGSYNRGFDQNKFRQTSLNNQFETISNQCQWVPSKSKNLKSAIRDYDPTQAGDTDDDI